MTECPNPIDGILLKQNLWVISSVVLLAVDR